MSYGVAVVLLAGISVLVVGALTFLDEIPNLGRLLYAAAGILAVWTIVVAIYTG